jgi:(E)-4-hydroxy-3-methylbut-2-enyl-diphosphate synthase
LDKWNIGDQAADYAYIGENSVSFEIPGTLSVIVDEQAWKEQSHKPRVYPLIAAKSFMETGELSATANFIAADETEIYDSSFIEKLKASKNSVLILETENEHAMPALRRAFMELMNNDSDIPVVIKRKYADLEKEHFRIYASTDAGGLFIDGLGDGIWVQSDVVDARTTNSLNFGILQATRTRISKTEYISCPSCGRTLFDLQETTAKIRARTEHLKGVKIGIMGCIVNGPGEMADADYGYVGTGVGKITLYKEKDVVKRNVPSENAVDELIDLIREHGDWIEPKEVEI